MIGILLYGYTAMTIVSGLIRDSLGVGVSGTVTVTSVGYQVSETGIVVSVPYSVMVSDGVVSLDLEAGTPVNLTFTALSGGVKYLDISFVVPSADTDLSQLVNTPISLDLLDTSVKRLAELIMGNPQYVASLQSNMRYRGAYDGGSLYFRGDVVQYDGSSYVFTSNVPLSGLLPSDTSVWFLMALRGANGTGTAGNNTPYDSGTWDGQTDAPTRNTIRDLVENTLVKQADVSGLAPINNPVLVNPSANSPDVAANNTRLVTTEWFWDRLEAVLPLGQSSAILTGTPSATTPSSGSNNGRIATTAFTWDLLAPIRTPSDSSANLTGTPVTVTPPVGNNSQRIANTAWVTNHVNGQFSNHILASDPHSQYLLDADFNSHLAAANPHSQYQLAIPDSGWLAADIAYGTAWSNHEGNFPFRYRKVGNIVYLRGFVQRATGTTSLSPLTLPVGYRPISWINVTTMAILNSAVYYLTRLLISPLGAVGITLINASGGVVTVTVSDSITWLSLDNIAFFTN